MHEAPAVAFAATEAPHRSARPLARIEATLRGLARKGRQRELAAADGVDFTSNDYLALAHSARLTDAARDALARGVPVGAGGSRLLNGNHPEHAALEAEAARFFGAESALFFGSGYAANLALFASLPQRGDLVVHDALVHASARDGIRAGRAEAHEVPHNDAAAVDEAIRRWRAAGATGTPWIAVESLYSMDGDRAPLDDLWAVARRHDAMLVVDEAHATGVHGPLGRGLATHLEGQEQVITLHTCGKALGASGALVLARATVRDYLINRARPFVYATAPSPLMAAVVRAALVALAEEPERRARLAALVDIANRTLSARLGLPESGSQILPVVVGDNGRAVHLAARLRQAGFDVRAIRPPTVPEGGARLRITVTLHADEAAIAGLFDVLGAAIAEGRP
ncbi:8-amino-7-oxononanoate synthase [Chelatococcus sp. SYSU_G07232]|uniref:8-amino-7-oxononanoate synthase n=1 Tax=Chelatococcus albus TaxID=3047466 RepID=A0ABT7AC97_9HYPH|nr:8-amino-7-oxononanoate synthase [Chelatococcus sp. SYSU_G07232]MDJ1156988.1 8-amino-7-oxononanoate synthase [Chelatococcus sp. SYSU_G07232]